MVLSNQPWSNAGENPIPKAEVQGSGTEEAQGEDSILGQPDGILEGSRQGVLDDHLVTLSSGKLFNSGRGYGYRGWPFFNLHNTVEAALRCANYYRGVADGPEDGLWIAPRQAALFTGLPLGTVRTRTRAALNGDTAAWSWCALKEGPLLYLPELWEECQWVKRTHALKYLGVVASKFNQAEKKGVLHFEDREFRRNYSPSGKRRGRLAVRIDEIIRYRTYLKMRKLFGTHFSYERLDTLLEMDVETVSRIFFAKLLVGATYSTVIRGKHGSD